MTRIMTIFVVLVMIASGAAYGESTRMDDAVIFDTAIGMLRQMDSRESVEEAESMFKGITSKYKQSNMFAIYASAILDIYDEDYDSALTRIEVLGMNQSFVKLLDEYGLQSGETMAMYVEGRRLEGRGDYEGALELYAQMNFYDSADRMVEILGKAKERRYAEAVALFDEGKYSQAAEVFRALGNYRDSAEMANKAEVLISTPTPVPTPSPKPTSVARQKAEQETREISDTWDQIVEAIDDGSAKKRYSIGETKELDLGTLGVVHMQLAGFDLDDRADGNGKAATTWIALELLPEGCPFNGNGLTKGGWKESELRDYLQTIVLEAIPTNLRRRLVLVEKAQIIPGSHHISDLQKTQEYLWIPDKHEIFGDIAIYYDLFKDIDKNRKKLCNNVETWWWLRSCAEDWSFGESIYYVSSKGYCSDSKADSIGGITLGFCL